MKKQQGMTLPSLLVVGLIGILLIKAAFAVVPMYWDNRMLTTVLNKLEQTPDERTQTPQTLRKLLGERISSNNLAIPMDELDIGQADGRLIMKWDYERRANWIGNIDVVARFHQQKEFKK